MSCERGRARTLARHRGSVPEGPAPARRLEACGLELLWATGLGEGRASVSRIASNLKAPSLRPSVRAGAVSLRVPASHSGRGWAVTALPVAWNIPLGRHQVEGSSNHQAAGHWIIGTIHRR